MLILENVKKATFAEKRRLKYYQKRFENSEISDENHDLKRAEILTRLAYLIPLQNAILHKQELAVYTDALISKLNIGSTADAFIDEINSGFDKKVMLDYEIEKVSANSEIEYGYLNLKQSLKGMKYKDLLAKELK